MTKINPAARHTAVNQPDLSWSFCEYYIPDEVVVAPVQTRKSRARRLTFSLFSRRGSHLS